MALDPEKYENFRNEINNIIDEYAPVDDDTRQFLVNKIFGEALGQISDLVEESREPRLYVLGRSGAGKSSLINALANKEVAEVGAVEPTTVDSELYHIPFPERHSSWEVVDSRGLFESVPPDGGLTEDTEEFMRRDIKEYEPDILIHVMTPDQIRAGEEDFEVIKRLREEVDATPPIVYCLNKVDTHMSPGDDWPPEENASLAGDIKENLDFVSQVLEEEDGEPFEENQPLYGYKFSSKEHIGVVPLYLKDEPYWNVETVSWLIGDFLPDDARLQFAQAQRRERLMRKISRDMTNRFAGIATGIGGAPTPVADIAVLTPMQLTLVAFIGSLSCREFEVATVQDYLGAMGGTTLAGISAREIARSMSQFLPGVGQAVSASVAGGTTWAIGRSAEEYFFNDEAVSPSKFIAEGRKKFENED